MERLAAEDRLMLWPDEFWPQDIGALAILDGAGSMLDVDGRFRVKTARRAVEARFPLRFPVPAGAPRATARAGRAAVDGRPGVRPGRPCCG